MFAGMASAATGAYFYNGADGSNVLKGDHTYGFNVDITDLNALISNFADVNPADTDCPDTENGTYAKNMLYVDFDYTNYDGFKLPTPYDQGCVTSDNRVYPPAVDVYVTFSKDGAPIADPYLVRVSPEVWTVDLGVCGTVVDRVYFPIERHNLPQYSDAKIYISEVSVKNFKLITPNNPGDYAPCIGHTVCFTDICTNITVVDTVAQIVDVDVVGCDTQNGEVFVAGNEVTVKGTVYSTEYLPNSCELKPWDGSTCAWPVLIEIKKVLNGCDECEETVCAFGDAMAPVSVTSEDNCGNLSIGSCGDKVLCAVTADIDENGYFSGKIKVPACLDGQDGDFRYVVRVSTIEVADANDDEVVDFQNDTYPELVPSESIEDLKGKTIDKPQPASLTADCGINSANGRHHIARQVIPVCVKDEAEALEHAWVQADLLEITVVPGKPWTIGMEDVGTQINFAFDSTDTVEGGCVNEVPIEVCLYDQYGNQAPNYNPCTLQGADVKVELMAVKNGVIPEETAGKFYQYVNGVAKEVTYVIIPAGKTCISDVGRVTFKPNATGYIDLKAITIFPDGQKKTSGWCNVEVNDCACIFEGPTILVEANECDLGGFESCYDCDKIAAAGWPVKFSVHYDPATLRVELLELDENNNLVAVDPADWNVQWNTELWTESDYLVFAATDPVLYPNRLSGDTYEHPDEGGVGYDANKSDFYVYTDLSACGKVLVVKVVDIANNETQVSEPIYFGTPTDMVRVMTDGWNLISTPVTLAGDGTLKTLFMDSDNPDGKLLYTDVLTYKDGAWMQPDPQDPMLPLDAYWVLMNQNFCKDCCDLGDCGKQKNIYATYVFDRVVNPMAAMQPTKDMNPGFNLIGPSFTREENVVNDYARFSHKWDCNYFAYDPCCNECSCIVPTEDGIPTLLAGQGNPECGDLCKGATFQTDRLYRMLATVSQGSRMVINPGGKGLTVRDDPETDYKYWGTGNSVGNLAPWTTAALGTATNPSWYDDPMYRAFNGDGYWLYVAETPQTLVGAATPILITD